MSNKIPDTPPQHLHRGRRVPLSKAVRAGLAQKSSLKKRGVVPVTLKEFPWKNKEEKRRG